MIEIISTTSQIEVAPIVVPSPSELIEALTFGKIPQEQKLVPEIGPLFNMRLGRSIDGRIPLLDLQIPNTNTEAGRKIMRDLIKIDPDLRGAFNSILKRAAISGLTTVGDVRRAKIEDLIKIKQVGELRGKFLHEIFQAK